MFYGGGRMPDSPGANRNAPPGPGGVRNRAERFDQMTKQEQLIEQKRREIEAKLTLERQRKELEALMAQQQEQLNGQSSSGVTSSSATSDAEQSSLPDAKQNVFANDGSFMDQFRKLQEQRQKEEVKVKEEPEDEYGSSAPKKPAFKLINPAVNQSSRTPADNEYGSGRSGSKRKAVDIYAPPPPPPGPGPPESVQQARRHFNQQRNSSGYQASPPPPPPPPPPPVIPPVASTWQPPPQVKAFALAVANGGDEVENMARKTKSDDPLMWFLYRPDSKEYQAYRDLVEQIRNEKSFNLMVGVPPPPPPPLETYPKNEFSLDQDMRLKRPAGGSGNSPEEDERERKRRSRWGPQSTSAVPPPGLAAPQLSGQGIPGPVGLANLAMFPGSLPLALPSAMGMRPGGSQGPMLSRATRTNPQLLSYARQSYGTVDLDEEQWKQCEEAYKMNLLFQDIARKKARDEQLAQSGKFKHEYDSDEEIDDVGTWEHKQRLKEMEKTKDWASELTERSKGKHHIGDFLPPEELNKFMNKYKAVKEGRQMDESAYQDFKIAQDNVGFKLLQKMGWSDGEGLGASGQGITAPIDKGATVNDKLGLGVEKPDDVSQEDDEYAAYRKRMMLAYRFRPNPLNNPRRAYY